MQRFLLKAYSTQDLLLIELDSLGNVNWSKCYGGSADDEINDFIITKDSCIVLAGYSCSENGDIPKHYGSPVYTDFWIVKTLW